MGAVAHFLLLALWITESTVFVILDYVRKDTTWQIMNVEATIMDMLVGKLSCFGHLECMGNNRLLNKFRIGCHLKKGYVDGPPEIQKAMANRENQV